MDKEHLIKLTLRLYGVTNYIPEQEPMRKVLRQQALAVLKKAALLLINPLNSLTQEEAGPLLKSLSQEVGSLLLLLAIAQEQAWANEQYFLVLKREYQSIESGASLIWQTMLESQLPAKTAPAGQPGQPAKNNFTSNNRPKQPGPRRNSASLRSPRHRKIIQLLEKKENAQVQDLKRELFPEISKRTLRRDMDYLLKAGFVVRQGDKNNTFYKLKR